MSTQQRSIENYINKYEKTLVCLFSVLQRTWENALSPYINNALAWPLQKVCVKLVSFHLHMTWLGVLSLLENIIYHPILIKTNAFYISGMSQILCREVNKNKGCGMLSCFTKSVYNLKKVRKEHPVLQHLPSMLLITDCELRHHINIERGDDFSLFNIKG